jgi:hypothetical protein
MRVFFNAVDVSEPYINCKKLQGRNFIGQESDVFFAYNLKELNLSWNIFHLELVTDYLALHILYLNSISNSQFPMQNNQLKKLVGILLYSGSHWLMVNFNHLQAYGICYRYLFSGRD